MKPRVETESTYEIHTEDGWEIVQLDSEKEVWEYIRVVRKDLKYKDFWIVRGTWPGMVWQSEASKAAPKENR